MQRMEYLISPRNENRLKTVIYLKIHHLAAAKRFPNTEWYSLDDEPDRERYCVLKAKLIQRCKLSLKLRYIQITRYYVFIMERWKWDRQEGPHFVWFTWKSVCFFSLSKEVTKSNGKLRSNVPNELTNKRHFGIRAIKDIINMKIVSDKVYGTSIYAS